jgi:hypothetical protein
MRKYLQFFSPNSRNILFLTLSLGLVISVLSIFFSKVLYADTVIYADQAIAYKIGDLHRLMASGLPPLFSVLAGLLCKIGFSVYYSVFILGAFFYIISVFPLYYFLCFFLRKKHAALGCLFYIIAPAIIKMSCVGLLNGGRNLFFILSFYLMLNFHKNRKKITLFYFGASLAGLSLIRSEGFIFVPFFLFAFILLFIKFKKVNFYKYLGLKIIFYLCVILLTFTACISPRLYQMYNRTGYPVTDSRQFGALKKYFEPAHKKISPNHKKEAPCAVHNQDAGKFSFLFWKFFILNFIRGTNGLYALVALVGMITFLLKKKWRLKHSLLLMFFILNTFIFFLFGSAYRYFTVNMLLLLPFTVFGFLLLYHFFRRFKLKLLFIFFVFLIGVAQIVQGLKNTYTYDRMFEKYVGHWIFANKKYLHCSRNHGPFTLLLLRFPQIAFWAQVDKVRIDDFVSPSKFILPPPGRPFMEGKHFSAETAFKVVEKLSRNGFKAKHLLPAMERIPGFEKVIPDLIVVQYVNTNRELIEKLETLPFLREIHTKWDKHVALFKVL